MDEEVWICAPRAGRKRDASRVARQGSRTSGEGEERRRLRLYRAGLRRLARSLRRRRRPEGREAGDEDQRVPGRLRVGPQRVTGVQDGIGTPAPGVSALPGGCLLYTSDAAD